MAKKKGIKAKVVRKSLHTIESVLSQSIAPNAPTFKKSKLNRVEFDGDVLYMDSHRYWVFKEKGTTCVCCGIQGLYFAKEKVETDFSYHLNLYAVDANGKEVLMTKDHIMPKSKGGIDHISNYQPMCAPCNKSKGSIIPEEMAVCV